MDVYKAPDSNLDIAQAPLFQPWKGILLGLLISFVFHQLMSNIVAVTYISMKYNATILQSIKYETFLFNNKIFLANDLAISIIMCLIAGYRLSKYVVNKEIKYAVILATILFLISVVLSFYSDNYKNFPDWYLISSYLSPFLATYLGALFQIRKSAKLNANSSK